MAAIIMSININCLKKDEKGLTLIEVLIALVIFSLIAVSVVSMYIPAAMWVEKAGKETRALYYASGIIEDLRAHNGNLYEVTRTVPGDENLNLNHGCKPDDMTAEITIDLRGDQGLNNLYEVTVTVSWFEQEIPDSLILATIIRKIQ